MQITANRYKSDKDPLVMSMLGAYMMKFEDTKDQGNRMVEDAYQEIKSKKVDQGNAIIFLNYGMLRHSQRNYKEALVPAIDRVIDAVDNLQQKYVRFFSLFFTRW